MDPEIEPLLPQAPRGETGAESVAKFDPPGHGPDPAWERNLCWVFLGGDGLRAGWSVLIFFLLLEMFTPMLGTVFVTAGLIRPGEGFSPVNALFVELIGVAAIAAAAAIMALLEGRRILDYNLNGPRRLLHFAGGLAAGFAALSALVGAMVWGGWLRIGPAALNGRLIWFYAALWGGALLLVGLKEEGAMRCYLLYTLTRGINFWWAAGLAGAMCAALALRMHGRGDGGVYVLALLGVVPCLALHLKRIPQAGFWQAAWVTSTYFAYGHTSNRGENWIGILAAGAIGFVFCVSVRLTGSAWWAIGCHSAWDWAETYFYGTADSGLVSSGHYLSATPTGAALWSGDLVGPEGSVLSLAIVLLLLAAILVLYGRPRRATTLPASAVEQVTG
jgi:uncharacterized protein